MWSDYFLYLMSLPERERKSQIIMIICFWIIMCIIGIIIEYVKKINFHKKC